MKALLNQKIDDSRSKRVMHKLNHAFEIQNETYPGHDEEYSANDELHPFFDGEETLYLLTFCEYLIYNSGDENCRKQATFFLDQCHDLTPDSSVEWQRKLKESFLKVLDATVEGAQRNWKLFVIFRNLEDDLALNSAA